MRFLLTLIGYLCTATVLSLVVGVGYLWQTSRLDDEKVFRIIALVHDVDIDGIEKEQKEQKAAVPDEEPSLADIERYRAVYARNFEVKQDALKRGSDAFDHSFRKLETATLHFSELANKIEKELQSQGELSSKKAVADVVRHLEFLAPDAAKQELIEFLKEPDGMKDVILLMNSMSTGKLKNLLKRFDENDLDDLKDIHRFMLSGGSQAEEMKKTIEELEAIKSQ
ncbi:MAG: hypothetical protein AAGJ46_09505 [Planctomycetota bacterium]